MLSANARSLLLILFKSSEISKRAIPSVLTSLGHFSNYKSIDSNNNPKWTDALISEINDQEKLQQLDTNSLIKTVEKEFNAENVLIAPMIHSIDCIKDPSNHPETDVFFAVAFTLKEKVDQFPQDWFKATPYMSSCAGFKRATVYKVLGDNPPYPYINIAIWSNLDSWKKAIATDQSKEAHQHQNHVQRTPFIAKFSPPSSTN